MQEQEVTTQEITTPTEIVVQAPEVTQPTRAENHLYSMRKKLEAEEDARKAVEKRNQELEAAMKSYQQQQQPAQVVQEEDDLDVDNEDYVQAKHIKTSNKKMSKKLSATEQRILDLEQKLSYFEAKVDTDALKDFDQVVSDDNLKTFARLYPDDYQTMMMQPNLKVKSKTAYNMIKNYGIMDMANNAIDSRNLEEKIARNKQKPQAASNVATQQPQTPMTRLNDYERRILSDADRDRIMAEVQRKKSIG